MEIDSSEQHSNASPPMIEISESDSNVTHERPAHDWKQDLQIISIDEGRQIARMAEQPSNADSPSVEI
jgi:hypothetical protein